MKRSELLRQIIERMISDISCQCNADVNDTDFNALELLFNEYRLALLDERSFSLTEGAQDA